MSRAIELREKRAKAWDAAKAFAESKRGANDLLSPEDAETYDRMEAEVVAMGKEIDRIERATLVEQNLTAPLNQAPVGNPAAPRAGRAADGYQRDFWNAMRGLGISNALKEGGDPEGGFLVPDEFEHRLIEALEEQNIMRQLANVIQTANGERKIPVVATKGTAAWTAEEAEILASDNTFGQLTLGAFKLTSLIKCSQELLADSAFPLESYIAKEFARRISVKEEEAFLIGSGTNQPTGILTDAQQGKTAASATAITLDEVIDLFYALKSPYRQKAVFVTNDLTMKALRKLKDNNGQYLWQPSIKEGTPDTILGKPIHTSGYVPQLAAGAKVLAFGDFSYYWIADRQNRTFQRLNELYATTGQVGFIATQRVDGKLILPEAMTVLAMAAS